ncbi:hypothetical protein MKX07_006639 [Trichoderma sp. CBMAI-0711]|nr:hypothetical protein MKX07_006639 [Trichoderma sp. CBMAI-0711]
MSSPFYKASRILDSWVQSVVLSDQKRISGVKAGIQDGNSHWFERSAPGIDSVERVNMAIDRGLKIVHPLSRKRSPGQIISMKKTIKH